MPRYVLIKDEVFHRLMREKYARDFRSVADLIEVLLEESLEARALPPTPDSPDTQEPDSAPRDCSRPPE